MSRNGQRYGEHVTVAPPTGQIDPVCGMVVKPDTPHRIDHAGTSYVFCSVGCLTKFREDPARYGSVTHPDHERDGKGSASTTAVTSVAYTCPRHPEIRPTTPGACPKCGMALEPVTSIPTVKTQWVCPMHPEIVRDPTGTCPICGMALELGRDG